MLEFSAEFAAILSAAFQLILLIYLAQGPWKRFIVLFAYVLVDLASTISETVANSCTRVRPDERSIMPPAGQKMYRHLFWVDELTLDLLLFALVATLTYEVLRETPMRKLANRVMGGAVLLVLVLPFTVLHPNFSPWPDGAWFNGTSQILNFAGAIMNLVLWAGLLISFQSDRQYLMVSIGVGLAVSGAAFSSGLLHLIPLGSFSWIPEMFWLLTHVGALLMWCWAFWPAPKSARARAPVISIERMR